MQPLAAATSAQFYGTIAVARQVTAPPQLYSRRMAVGRHRHTPIGVTVKGCRALVKVYTDVWLRVGEANACYGMGLEPVIAMVCYWVFSFCVHEHACRWTVCPKDQHATTAASPSLPRHLAASFLCA